MASSPGCCWLLGSDVGLLCLKQNAARGIHISHRALEVLFALKVKIKLLNQGDFTAFKKKLLPCLHLPLLRSIKVYGIDLQEKRTCWLG